MIRLEKSEITRYSIQPIHRKYGQNIFSPYEWTPTYVGHNIDAWLWWHRKNNYLLLNKARNMAIGTDADTELYIECQVVIWRNAAH